jgi:hypothetical protein
MSKIEIYREKLRQLKDWEPFLLSESGLPGPRGNIELAQAVAEEGNEELFEHYLTFDPVTAPVNSPQEFLAFCGALGQGKLLAEGKRKVLPRLRQLAADPRWRTREAVAMALQRYGDADMDGLLEVVEQWSQGSRWEQRAAIAALCEPRLLKKEIQAARVLDILDRITASLKQAKDSRDEGFKVLRQALGYGWSVAVVALPGKGKALMERWLVSGDRDVRWVMRENLKKNRLIRMDAKWVEQWSQEIDGPNPKH